MVGLSRSELKTLPQGIIGIPRTQNVAELVSLYSTALVYVNPTWEESFSLTNVESQACGTPVITYDTGGSPETIDKNTGFVVPQGNIEQVATLIQQIEHSGKAAFSAACRTRAEEHFRKEDRFNEYYKLYENLISR